MAVRRLSDDKVAPEAQAVTADFHKPILDEVIAAVERDRVVVVGMAQNPVVKKARKLLEAEGIAFTYLEYGSYLSQYRQRLAIKMWAGYPLYPMVFLGGTLIGGYRELAKLQAAGALAEYKK